MFNRVTAMGQLAASIAHEVNQPIAATVTNAQAALRWLDRRPADLEEVRQALARIAKDGHRAAEVIDEIRALIKKSSAAEGSLGDQWGNPRGDCAHPRGSGEERRLGADGTHGRLAAH